MLDLPLRTLLSESALRSLFLLPILSIFILLVSRLFCSWNFFCYSSRSKSVAGDSRLVFNVVRVPVGVSSSLNERIARSTTMRWASFSSDCSSFLTTSACCRVALDWFCDCCLEAQLLASPRIGSLEKYICSMPKLRRSRLRCSGARRSKFC
jgi:hypothetical protein